ncbi:MAG: hypothetical protein RIM99_09075 [Cyclobacteriaceae bacterium]
MRYRILALFTLLLIGLQDVAAQRCKYLVDEKDPITDDIIRTIKNRITGPISGISPYYYFYYVRSGSNHTFKVEVADYGESTAVIPEKSEMIIRLEDGGLIRIYSKNKAQPEQIKELSEVLTSYTIEYDIPEEEMKKITASGIVFIRATDFNNSFSDQKIPRPVTIQSRNNAKCIFRE